MPLRPQRPNRPRRPPVIWTALTTYERWTRNMTGSGKTLKTSWQIASKTASSPTAANFECPLCQPLVRLDDTLTFVRTSSMPSRPSLFRFVSRLDSTRQSWRWIRYGTFKNASSQESLKHVDSIFPPANPEFGAGTSVALAPSIHGLSTRRHHEPSSSHDSCALRKHSSILG
ncbi:hypothetical protein BCR44DRAFT_1282321 [Catenaria anguillulae PL171]|uniref:Uncharacterized protein n=1 Tax=Catenaria anguillulae PL171 TaxID=765915 RepID=A0A1Y2HW18_9FUNG|nr:hypothetical protein BCR44DRAFT_1282321 [Catenaria anguillulae PL171]